MKYRAEFLIKKGYAQKMRILVAILLLLCSCAAQATDLITGTVVAVHDGDTLRLDTGVNIRLWGIDAPELDTRWGPAAGEALRGLALGQPVTCHRLGESYRRVVAQCWAGGVDLSQVMVEAGWARDWPRFSGGQYRQAQHEARQNHLGVNEVTDRIKTEEAPHP